MSGQPDEQRARFWCRVFGHRWEQAMVGGWWRFRCQRCDRVEGYCGQATLKDGDPVTARPVSEQAAYVRCQLCSRVIHKADGPEHIRMHGVAALEDGEECGND